MSNAAIGGTVETAFRDRLRDAIKDPQRRMLLRASDVWRQHDPSGSPCRPVFETSSHHCHDEFVTLWGLFEESKLFAECIDHLAALARQVRDEKGYTTIVTSTATARHLVEYVHSKIESANDRIAVRYLGPYPFLGAGNREVINFKGEKVLIVADVIDSGTVVMNLAKAVRDLNGVPVAALCLVLVNEDHISRLDEKGEILLAVELDADENETHLRVHSLTDHAIPETPVPEHPSTKEKQSTELWELIKIDPETLLPIVPPPRHTGIKPAIDTATMYRQMEEADAITFDYFQTESGLLTTAIRFDNLFRRCPGPIWAAIRPYFGQSDDFKPPLVVTTFDWGDLQFKEFVEDQLSDDGEQREVVFAGRKNSGEYFIQDHHRDVLQDKRVVLLLSSVQSGEKVKDLSTLLAGLEVREIQVVCLVNRMGRQTAEFLRRAHQLLRGLGESSDAVPFNFHTVYCLSELSSDDIRCAQDTVFTLLGHYQAETRVPSFRRWVSQVRAYFEPKPLTSFEFTGGKARRLAEPVKVPLPGKQWLTVATEDAKLSALCGHVAADRNYDPILDELESSTQKYTLYKLFSVLLSDISYLRMLCRFGRLKKILQKRVTACRDERIKLEANARASGRKMTEVELNRLEELIELELHFLFGWSLFSFLDQHFNYPNLIWDVVTSRLDIQDWESYPENVGRYYGDERVVWTASMLLLLSHPRFLTAKRATPLRDRLLGLVRKLVERVQDDLPPPDATPSSGQSDAEQSRLLKIKANLDMLLTELGTHKLRQPVDVIRYLQSLLLKTRRHHSPLDTNMNQAVEAVQRSIRQLLPRPIKSAALDLTNRRVPITASDQLALLDDGIYIAGQLQVIADAVNRLFFFSLGSAEKAERFLATPDRPGFAADVTAFGDSLQSIRRDKLVSITDRDKLTELRRVILRDLWNDKSLLRETLARYVAPLEPTIVVALEAACKTFREKPYSGVWDKQIDRLTALPREEWHYALIEPLLLREVMKNIFTNARHNLKGIRSPKNGYSNLVEITIDEEIVPATDGEEELRKWVIKVTTKGNAYANGGSADGVETTFDQHRREVSKYGGHLAIGPYLGKRRTGTEVELRLLSRNEYCQLPCPPTGESNASGGMG